MCFQGMAQIFYDNAKRVKTHTSERRSPFSLRFLVSHKKATKFPHAFLYRFDDPFFNFHLFLRNQRKWESFHVNPACILVGYCYHDNGGIR